MAETVLLGQIQTQTQSLTNLLLTGKDVAPGKYELLAQRVKKTTAALCGASNAEERRAILSELEEVTRMLSDVIVERNGRQKKR